MFTAAAQEASLGDGAVREVALWPHWRLVAVAGDQRLHLLDSCSLASLAVSGDPAQCRRCPHHPPGYWRCDDGLCIAPRLVRNGIPDCGDGSDEDRLVAVGWLHLLLATLGFLVTGMAISYICR